MNANLTILVSKKSTGVLISSVLLCFALFSSAAQARVYLYQMPDGSRMLSDHPLINTKGKLVRNSKDLSNMGHYVARRTIRAKRRMRVWS